ncbi:hypothetical protein MKW94_006080, partial [Papaver nudicaule]|nr:hypothetical protein [Papaver nudicaule]
ISCHRVDRIVYNTDLGFCQNFLRFWFIRQILSNMESISDLILSCTRDFGSLSEIL